MSIHREAGTGSSVFNALPIQAWNIKGLKLLKLSEKVSLVLILFRASSPVAIAIENQFLQCLISKQLAPATPFAKSDENKQPQHQIANRTCFLKLCSLNRVTVPLQHGKFLHNLITPRLACWMSLDNLFLPLVGSGSGVSATVLATSSNPDVLKTPSRSQVTAGSWFMSQVWTGLRSTQHQKDHTNIE